MRQSTDLRVYHLPPGSGPGRTGLLSESAPEGPDSSDFSTMLSLFPTRLHLKHWQRRIFHPFAGQCYMPPMARTLREMAINTAKDAGHNTLDATLRPSIISTLTGHGAGFSTLASTLIGELKHRFPGMESGFIGKKLTDKFDESDIPDEVRSHAMRAMEAFGMYEAALKEAGYIDPEDALSIAAKHITDGPAIESLVLDGFYELTKAELVLTRALINKSRKALICVPVTDPADLSYCFTPAICEEFDVSPVVMQALHPPAEPRLNAASSSDNEIESMARHIKQRHLSGSMRELEDVLIVFPDIQGHASTIKRVFDRYGIPVNQATAPRAALKAGPWSDLMSLLRAIDDGYPRLEFARFLTSPHFMKIPNGIRSKTPSATLSSGVLKGKKAWIEALESKAALGIFKALEPLERISRSATYERHTSTLIEVLKALAFHPGIEGMAEAVRIISRLLPCNDITRREIPLSIYIDTLEQILRPASEEEETPGVELASIFDVRGLEPEALYMCGLKDGDIPARPDIDLLLPDAIRRRLDLVDVDRYMHLQEKIFRRLQRSARELYLSYASMQEDKIFLPSAFLSDIKESPYSVTGHLCAEEAMTAWGGDSLLQRQREIRLPGAFGKDRVLGVTEIDAYRRCPRFFAIERVLGMSPTEISEYEIEPTTLGTISHRIMELLITGHPGTMEDFTLRAQEAIEAALSEGNTDRFFGDLIRESFMKILPEIYEIEVSITGEGYKVQSKEARVEAEPAPGIKLKGKADRVDIRDDGKAAIIDYKTGLASISGQALEKRGEHLQLFLYAAMLRRQGIEPERAGIYSLKDLKVKWVPGKKDKDKDLGYFADRALEFLASTVKDMRAGQFTARPISANICNNCHEAPFCPYFQSTGDNGGSNA